MANGIHSMAASSSEAQPVLSTGEVQFADSGCSSEERTPSSNHLNPQEEEYISHEENGGETSAAPQVVYEGSAKAKFRQKVLKMLKTQSADSPRARVEQMVESKIDQLRPSQRKPHEMDKLMRSLSSSVRRHFRVRGRWQEIQGCCRWEGLLDPLDPGLRAEIFRYMEFAKATYDAFDRDLQTANHGCKFTERELLNETGLNDRGYQISQFLYTTTRLRLPQFRSKVDSFDYWMDSNWMGFVGVCTSRDEIERLGRRDIVVAWRGTVTRHEWIKDAQFWKKPVKLNPQNAGEDPIMVESGFMSMYSSSNQDSPHGKNSKKSAQEQVLRAVEDLVEKYQDEKHNLSITITGHSLGSALATLCAYDIAEKDWINLSPEVATSTSGPELGGSGSAESISAKTFPANRIPITVYSFAGPRVGNQAFKNKLEELGVPVLRVVNGRDMVPKLPSELLLSYTHVGVELDIHNLPCDYQTDAPGLSIRRVSTRGVSTRRVSVRAASTRGVSTREMSIREVTDASPPETDDESANANPPHAHNENGGIHALMNPWRYLAAQHRIGGMLQKVSPACIAGYTNMVEALRARRALTRTVFRQRVRAYYLRARFVGHLQKDKT